VRTYKRKTSRRGSRDKRMATVARLHADGISNREIARLLAVSHTTVANDLSRWDRERPNVTPLVANPAGKSYPVRGVSCQPDLPSDSNVVPSVRRARRRSAAGS